MTPLDKAEAASVGLRFVAHQPLAQALSAFGITNLTAVQVLKARDSNYFFEYTDLSIRLCSGAIVPGD